MCLGLGAAALAIGGGLYFVFDGVYLGSAQAQALGPEVLESARLAYLLVVASVAAGFVMRLPYGILEAHDGFLFRNAIMATELLARLGLTVLLLSMEASVHYVALAQVACLLLEFALAMLVIRRRHPEVPFTLRNFDRARVRPIVGFSLFAMVLNVGAMLAFRVDALVIGGSSLGPAGVTAYDNGNKFFEHMIALVLGIAMVVMPAATRMKARGDTSELREIFLKWSKVSFSLSLLVGLYLLVAGPDFLAWWLPAEEYDPLSGTVTQVLVVSFFFFLPVRGVALPILMGLGLPSRPALGILAMGLLNLGISLAVVEPYGVLGVALGTAIPNVLFAGFVLFVACRELEVGIGEYLMHVGARAVVASLLPVGLLLAWRRTLGLESTLEVFGAGVAMVAVFGLAWVLFVYRGDRHFDLHGMARARLARLGGGGRP
jgi:O-antigen/teichoic acid export membrane protein